MRRAIKSTNEVSCNKSLSFLFSIAFFYCQYKITKKKRLEGKKAPIFSDFVEISSVKCCIFDNFCRFDI